TGGPLPQAAQVVGAESRGGGQLAPGRLDELARQADEVGAVADPEEGVEELLPEHGAVPAQSHGAVHRSRPPRPRLGDLWAGAWGADERLSGEVPDGVLVAAETGSQLLGEAGPSADLAGRLRPVSDEVRHVGEHVHAGLEDRKRAIRAHGR